MTVRRSLRRVSVILVRFQWNLSFLNTLSKYTQISNFMKIRSLGTKLFNSDRQTEEKTWQKLTVVFRDFTKAPTNRCRDFIYIYVCLNKSDYFFLQQYFFHIFSSLTNFLINWLFRSLCQSCCRSLSRIERFPGCTTRRWIYSYFAP